jgi:rhodanese-related sulfurtransferase
MEWEYAPQQVADLMVTSDAQLIDVRQPHEYEAGRIAGARLIQLMELAARAQELDPNKPLVFYCRSGSRSALATKAFRNAGYDAYNMSGGLLEWRASNLPLEPSDGYVADT